jgi:hypothetical protein
MISKSSNHLEENSVKVYAIVCVTASIISHKWQIPDGQPYRSCSVQVQIIQLGLRPNDLFGTGMGSNAAMY